MKFIIVFLIAIASIYLTGSSEKEKAQKEAAKIPASPIVFCGPSFDPSKINEGNAPIFNGLGNLHYRVSTKSELAQKYFNQGLTLLYAFNHTEAGRSFNAAIKLDSTLAMAYWGMGMVLGPNYNAALNPTKLADINEVMDKAVKYSSNATPREQALIYALRQRFPRNEVAEMTAFNAAYAAAMKKAHEDFPDDVEIGALYADAMMNEHPWNLWLKDGTAQPWTPAIVSVLESMLAKFPDHPGLNHMYIHAMEASRSADKALPSADKLREMLPAAGHLVHMPSHIYIRTGQYHKGVIANEKASAADSNYIAQCKVQGSYALMLYPHNIHFLAACAFLEGNSRKAIDAAWMVSRKADRNYIADNITVQQYFSIPYYVMVHMAKWDDILKLDQPGWRYPKAVWHYARGMAFTAKRNLINAEEELRFVKEAVNDEKLKTQLIWETNSAHELVKIADLVLSAEIATAKKDYTTAISLLREGVKIEDGLMYQEPPDWFFSVRHTLGHVLVLNKQFAEAEKIYREDLVTFRENGWALIGLYNSLKGQNKTAEAKEVKRRFEKAWKHADMKISSSRHY